MKKMKNYALNFDERQYLLHMRQQQFEQRNIFYNNLIRNKITAN